jgi:Domain of unknown function (DUF4402)
MKNVNSRAALRNLTLKIFVAAAAFGAASSASAATLNIPATATIIPPITLAQPADLRFASIAAGATAGTIVVTLPATIPAAAPTTAAPILGNRTATTAVAVGGLVCSATVLCGPGSLQITGLASATFNTVTVPVTTTLTGAGPAMTLTTTKRYGGTGAAGVITGAGTLDATGNAVLLVAGSLAIGTSALQTAGLYTGTLAIVVDY